MYSVPIIGLPFKNLASAHDDLADYTQTDFELHHVVPHKAPLKEESVSLSWPLIKFNASQKRKIYPLVYFDVGFDPRQSENIKYRTSGLDFHSLPITDRDLPVSTHCTVTEMIIECPHIGQIVVVRQAGIRCLDVFYEIYRGYHERLGHHELPRDSQRYWPAFELRCQYGPNRDHEVRAGFRRVDLLQGKRIFDGLTRLGANWELHFQ
ncbi:hypothetical protein C8J57DRAFT_1283556 [Mycena rebaudengoi]|nr:hypothetical protein C8J57DRAFT_1283556 [Mycena rebaudengoi]